MNYLQLNQLKLEISEALSLMLPEDREVFNDDVMITGASGFVGKWLLTSWIVAREQFNATGSLTCVSRHPAGYPETLLREARGAGANFHFSDIRNLANLDLSETRYVIHGATPTTLGLTQSALVETASTIIDGQQSVINFSKQNNVRRLLFLSSGAVYGTQPPDHGGWSEDDFSGPDPLNPRTAYHEAKRFAETLGAVAAISGEFEFISARLFAFMAPLLPLDAHFAAGNFVRDALRGTDLRLTGTGHSLRSYQYGTDLIVWLWTILRRGANMRAYNVGSDEVISIEQLAREVIQASGRSLQLVKLDETIGDHKSHYSPNIKRANIELGLRNFVSLEVAIRRTMSWWLIQ